jgi:uncharacterized protein
MDSTETQRTNRLIHSSSPYLLQHAHNPVDWYEWGEEAFAAAREQDRMIFLSVGYSTCYWCHVMERECFENEAIAQLMNEHFINIKVDREERPDVDDIYMTAVQLITRQGGWPMSVWLEPASLKPVVGGTYFPPQDSYGRPGFPSVLKQLADAWRNQREQVLKQADQVATAVAQVVSQQPPIVPLRREQVEQAVAMLMRQYDRNHGGFGGAPKFPTPVNLDLLMNVAWDRDDVRGAVTHTLNRMATGGMYDQIGGGFHRYSVDEKWLVPHFEKMLYDNGQLVSTYAKAFELTGDAFYERVLRRTLEYVLREMTDEDGAFYSAQDAEVDAREGLNYLWTADDVRDVLKHAGLQDEIDFALEVYGFTRGTNFQDPHHPDDEPKNVVYLIDHPESLASSLQISKEAFLSRIDRINDALLEARNRRKQPRLDDKIIAGWNGLMIAGFAEASRVLNEPRYLEAAKRAAAFVLNDMRTVGGELYRTMRRGKPGTCAVLEDYAFLVQGLLSLHRATKERTFLDQAIELTEMARERFADESSAGGGFFDTLEGQSDLFVRTKGHYDGATPSGNSVMMLNLIELADRTGKEQYLELAAHSMRAFSGFISQQPTGVCVAVRAMHEVLKCRPELILRSELQAPAGATEGTGGAGGAGGTGGTGEGPVSIDVEPGEVRFDDSGTADVEIIMRIADGYHINAHEPGVDGLIPLTIEAAGDGVELTPAYPSGERMESAAFAVEPVMVYAGVIRVPVELKRRGDVRRVRLIVTYQPCTDQACERPRRDSVELNVRQT